MEKYVVGFAFDRIRENVLLMLKNRPLWQAGHYNGLGGKIELGETPESAMHRESSEESGLILPWQLRGSITGLHHDTTVYICHLFYCYDNHIYQFKQIEDEQLEIIGISHLHALPILSNVRYLLSFGKYADPESSIQIKNIIG